MIRFPNLSRSTQSNDKYNGVDTINDNHIHGKNMGGGVNERVCKLREVKAHRQPANLLDLLIGCFYRNEQSREILIDMLRSPKIGFSNSNICPLNRAVGTASKLETE